ncbi:hypothetical protein FACS189444_6090 [Spirochaetia bacterium]|nr:hypothetical protein FACS189444_6090 [Spirochaetia bacterium]
MFPEVYNHMKASKVLLFFMGIVGFMGIQRVSSLFPINDTALTPEEYTQAHYLTYRNALNKTTRIEALAVYGNAKKVASLPYPDDIPVLLFSSDGSEVGSYWSAIQKDAATALHAELIQLECGHYIHQYEAARIAEECKRFLKRLKTTREPR